MRPLRTNFWSVLIVFLSEPVALSYLACRISRIGRVNVRIPAGIDHRPKSTCCDLQFRPIPASASAQPPVSPSEKLPEGRTKSALFLLESHRSDSTSTPIFRIEDAKRLTRYNYSGGFPQLSSVDSRRLFSLLRKPETQHLGFFNSRTHNIMRTRMCCKVLGC